MGALTRGTIVSEGLLLAGNPSITLRAQVWLNAWLADVYDSWFWPFLYNRYLNLSIPQGAPSIVIGPAGTLVADQILKFRRAVLADTVNTVYKGELDIQNGENVSNFDEAAWLDPH